MLHLTLFAALLACAVVGAVAPSVARAETVVATGTWGTCPWEITDDGVLTIHEGVGGQPDAQALRSPWSAWKAMVTEVRTACSDGARVVAPSCTYLFLDMNRIRSCDLGDWDVSSAQDVSGMFYGCGSLASLDLSGWDTSAVTEAQNMFSGCSALRSLDLSSWNTAAVTNTHGMFSGCSSLASLDVSTWDVSSVVFMGSMFARCPSLRSLDITSWDVSSVANMSYMFEGCSSLEALDLSGWDVSSVATADGMFAECSSLVSLDLAGWRLSPVTTDEMSPGMVDMFYDCASLTSLDLTGWDVSRVTITDVMFEGCSSLETLDVTGWRIGTALPWFYGLTALTELRGISDWDTSAVTTMASAFEDCGSLESLDLSGWDTSSVVDARGMFDGCFLLAEFRVGDKYVFNSADMMPESTAQDDGWWSEADRAWLSKDEIVGSRSGMADTYRNSDKGRPADMADATVLPIEALVYTGSALTPSPTVMMGEAELVAGVDYELIYENNVDAGTATVTVVGKGACEGTKTVTFQIDKATQTVTASNVSVAMGKTAQVVATASAGGSPSAAGKLTYKTSDATVAKVSASGKVTPVKVGTAKVTIVAAETGNYRSAKKTVTVTVVKGTQVVAASDKIVTATKTVKLGAKASRGGKLSYKSSNTAVATVSATGVVTGRKAGTVKITITAAATDNWKKATKTVVVKVGKAANTLVAKARKATVGASLKTLKTKSVVVVSNVAVTKARGAVAYANASSNATAKKLKVNAKTGKVTVPKGTKKGTYTVKVKVTAKGDATYKPASKTVAFKLKVA
jgi:surface protein